MTSNNIYLLEQAANLLKTIDSEVYSAAPGKIAKSGVGSHIRHCLDFYDCFLRGIAAGKIDYDCRERNEIIEQNLLAAQAKIENIISELRCLSGQMDEALMVKLEGDQAGNSSVWSISSIGRELQFLLSHTVHHFALIAMLLRIRGVEPAANFGIAPSTLKHWQAGR